MAHKRHAPHDRRATGRPLVTLGMGRAMEDAQEGPKTVDDGVNFHLSRSEPARQLLWIALAMGFGLLMAWFGGKLDGKYLLTFAAVFSVMYAISWYQETNAELDRAIKLRICREGIAMPEKFSGVIGWEDIESVASQTHKGETTFYIVPTPAAASRLPINQGWRKWMVGKGIDMHITPLEGENDDVFAAIRRYAPARLSSGL